MRRVALASAALAFCLPAQWWSSCQHLLLHHPGCAAVEVGEEGLAKEPCRARARILGAGVRKLTVTFVPDTSLAALLELIRAMPNTTELRFGYQSTHQLVALCRCLPLLETLTWEVCHSTRASDSWNQALSEIGEVCPCLERVELGIAGDAWPYSLPSGPAQRASVCSTWRVAV